jgi:hypothetical protein
MKLVFILLLLVTGLKSNGQQLGYRNGFIVTQTNDTIICWVPVASTFGDKISIKRSVDGDEETIPLNRIKYLVTKSTVYENVSFKKKGKEIHKLMWLEVAGKLNLYLEITSNGGGSAVQSGSSLTFSESPSKTYVLRKGDSTYLIDKKNFVEKIKPVISDNIDLTGKVDTKFYNFDNIDTLIRDYNSAAKPD